MENARDTASLHDDADGDVGVPGPDRRGRRTFFPAVVAAVGPAPSRRTRRGSVKLGGFVRVYHIYICCLSWPKVLAGQGLGRGRA